MGESSRFGGAVRLERRPLAHAVALWACLVTVAAACGGDAAASVDSPRIAVITVQLPTDTLRPTAAAQATVEARDAAGVRVRTDSIAWSIQPASVARVSVHGVVTAIAAGSASLTARVQGLSATRQIHVVNPPVDQLVVAPAQLFIAPGESRRIIATPLDAAGGPLPDRPVVWLSTDTARVVVTPDGVITAVSPGRAVVAAVSEKVYTVVDVRISGPPGEVSRVILSPAGAAILLGDSLRFQVTLEDSIGNVARDRQVFWSSSQPTVAPVSANGTVTGLAAGAAFITARSERGVDSVRVAVSDPADAIEVFIGRPMPGELTGDTLQVVAHARGRHEIASMRASVTSLGGDLSFVTAKDGWRGVVGLVPLHYGAYEVVVTATDVNGNTGVAAIPFSKGAVIGLGGLGNPVRSK